MSLFSTSVPACVSCVSSSYSPIDVYGKGNRICMWKILTKCWSECDNEPHYKLFSKHNFFFFFLFVPLWIPCEWKMLQVQHSSHSLTVIVCLRISIGKWLWLIFSCCFRLLSFILHRMTKKKMNFTMHHTHTVYRTVIINSPQRAYLDNNNKTDSLH